MWWQDQVYLLGGMGFSRDVPILALVMVADAGTGFSKWLAAKLQMEAQRDALLLSIMFLLFVQFLYFGDFLPHYPFDFRPGFRDGSVPDAVLDRREALYALDVWFLWGLVITSTIVCVALAMRQGRSVLVWLVLGVLGNAGSVAWLVMRRREVAMPPQQRASESQG